MELPACPESRAQRIPAQGECFEGDSGQTPIRLLQVLTFLIGSCKRDMATTSEDPSRGGRHYPIQFYLYSPSSQQVSLCNPLKYGVFWKSFASKQQDRSGPVCMIDVCQVNMAAETGCCVCVTCVAASVDSPLAVVCVRLVVCAVFGVAVFPQSAAE